MRLRNISSITVFLAMTCASVWAGKPPRFPVWYEDHQVTMTVVNDNVVGVEREILEDIANPLFSFGPPGNQPQADVITVVPGESGYNPWWEVYNVTVLNGRNVTTDPFTSAEEILEAAEAGTVRIVETEFFFLCQILFGGKR